jgi:WD40 repeat protein/serine/threonine protein kinase/tetratricopeptide (TPR) repeat protein
MNQSLDPAGGPWSAATALRVEEACDRFEAAWQTGQRPRIEDYIRDAAESVKPALLRELLALELEYRRRTSENPTLNEYLARFPQFVGQVHDLFEAHAAPRPGGQFDPLRTRATENSTQTVGQAEPVGAAPRVPGYEVLRELGRGGMGVVYQARHRTLGRVVALKMLLGGAFAGPQERERFKTEAEAAARLQHPNIVQIFEVGEEKGCPYLALEYVDGGSLDQKLQGTPLPARQAAGLVETLARAVHEAHRRGIVHRDLKPANILLQRKSEIAKPQFEKDGIGVVSHLAFGIPDFSPKVTDFGLAKRLDVATAHTQSGALLGTPDYMAPEQAGGGSKEVGPPADVYALGAILYYLLAGRPPFRAATPLETLLRVRSEEAVPPSLLQPAVPRDLETVCLKCLEKDPTKRYSSAAGLAEDLERFLQYMPVQARPVGRAERLWRWCRRNPLVAGLEAFCVLAIVGGFGGVLTQWRIAEAARVETARTAALEKVARQKAETEKKKVVSNSYFAKIGLAHREWLANNLGRAEQLLHECPRALRHWEWNHLKRLCHPEILTIAGPSPVTCVVFSPDRRHLAWGDAEGRIRLAEAETGREMRMLRGHSGPVTSLAFSAHGKFLASAGTDKKVRIWDGATGTALHTLTGHAGAVRCVAFRADGKWLASGGDDGTVRLWESTTGRGNGPFKGQRSAVYGVAFARDGRIASAGADHTVRVWNPSIKTRPLILRGHADLVRGVAFSPNGKQVASASWDGSVRIWNLVDRKTVTLSGHTQRVESVAYCPDGIHLASASGDGAVKIWDTTGGKPVQTLRGHVGGVLGVVYSPNGKWLASAGDFSIKLWQADGSPEALTLGAEDRLRDPHRPQRDQGNDLRPPQLTEEEPAVCGNIHAVAFHPNGRALASANADGSVALWSLLTGHITRTFPKHVGRVTCVAFSPDGKLLASGGLDQTVKVWDPDNGQDAFILRRHSGWVTSLAFSFDGKFLASACSDQFVRLWDVPTGNELRTLEGHTGLVTGVCFSPHSRWVASAGFDRTVKIWEVASGKLVANLRGHRDNVHDVAFSPDGRHLASVGSDRTVILWDTVTRQQIRSFQGHTAGVWGVAFHPDGKRLASASLDKTVKIWDPAREQEILTLSAQHLGCHGVAFSPDGRRLAVVGTEGTVSIRDGIPPSARPGQSPGVKAVQPLTADPLAISPKEEERLASKVRKALARPIRLDKGLDPNSRLGDILAHLSDRLGLSIAIDANAFKQVTGKNVASIKSMRVAIPPLGGNVRCSTVLWLALSQVDLAYVIRGDVLVVTTAQRALIDNGIPLQGPPSPITATDLLLLASAGRERQLQQVRQRLFAASLTIDKELDARTPLKEALSMVEDYLDVPIIILPKTFSVLDGDAVNEGESDVTGHPVSLSKMENVSLDIVLSHLLAQVNGTYLLLPDAVLVVGRRGKRLLGSAAREQWFLHASEASRKAGQGRWRQAISAYSKAIQLNPYEYWLWVERGRARFAARSFEKAIADYSRAIELNADDALPHYLRIRAYVKLGRRDRAVAECTKHIDPVSGATLVPNLRVDPISLAGEPRAASFPSAPRRPEPWFLYACRGIIFREGEQWGDALHAFSRALALKANAWWVWSERASVHDRLCHWELSVKDYSTALKLMSKRSGLWRKRALASIHLGRWRQAATDFSKVIELEKWDLDTEQVITDLSKLIKLDPRGSQGDDYILLRAAAGDTALYRKACSDLLKESGARRLEVAWVCARTNGAIDDYGQSLRVAREWVRDVPGFGIALKILGAVLYRAGKYQEAVARLKEALQADLPQFSGPSAAKEEVGVICLFLAMAHHRLGHATEAMKWLSKARREMDTARQDGAKMDGKLTRTELRQRLEWHLLNREAEKLIEGKKPGSARKEMKP